MKRSDVVAGALFFGVPLLIAGSLWLNRPAQEDDGVEPRLDELAAECVAQDGGFGGCDERVALAQSTLKNAATAEESYATTADGRYTRRIGDLEAEGLAMAPEVQLRVIGPVREGYCLEATVIGLRGRLHYSSDEGTPARGPCPP